MTRPTTPRPDTPAASDLAGNGREDSREPCPDGKGTPFTMVGEADGAVCVDGVCRVPGAHDAVRQPADRTEHTVL